MALDVAKNSTEVVQRAKIDVQRQIPESDPFLKNSWLGALITAFANRVYDFYSAMGRAFLEAIPDTAVLNLPQWAAIWNVVRNPALQSSGNFVVIGTAGGLISKDAATLSTWADKNGNLYDATVDVTIVLQSLGCTITRSGSVATLTTTSDHLIASNVLITVTGAVETEYNVTGATCTVTGPKTLTYTVSGSPSFPATGTILLGFTSVSVAVKSREFGVSKNKLFDAVVTLQSPITDVDDSASVDFGELGNGSDQETDEDLRLRFLNKLQNPISHFSVAEIESLALTLTGVTRVFVQEITPSVGQATIYFMRDNDTDPIPSASEVTALKTLLDTIRPANTDTLDLIVAAPTANSEDYTFSSITPDTSAMRTAITNSLIQFYAERVTMGTNIVEEAYNAAIFGSVTDSGIDLELFTLSTPSADLVIGTAEIGTLGVITFS